MILSFMYMYDLYINRRRFSNADGVIIQQHKSGEIYDGKQMLHQAPTNENISQYDNAICATGCTKSPTGDNKQQSGGLDATTQQ